MNSNEGGEKMDAYFQICSWQFLLHLSKGTQHLPEACDLHIEVYITLSLRYILRAVEFILSIGLRLISLFSD